MTPEVRAREWIKSEFGVSRETLDDLSRFEGLIRRWTETINLISKHDCDRIWSRHIADSFSLANLLPDDGLWVDIGSGGGFPALPLSLFCRDRSYRTELCMIESDARKAAFLGAAVRELGVKASIRVERVEKLSNKLGDVRFITSRALASVDKTLNLVERLAGNQTEIALIKGRKLKDELTEAQKRWHISFRVMKHPLFLEGAILLIQGFRRANSS